ncbi:MAG: class I SAM-dependent methyltransferase, partial [Anaerolineae bacterium]
MTDAPTQALDPGFERVACGYCGSSETTLYAQLEDWLCGLPGHFTMVRCTQCGVLRLNPRPDRDTIGRYYLDDYKPFADTLSIPSALENRIRAWSLAYGLRRRVRVTARHQPTGRLLDVGCATGLFLDAAQRYGRWEVQGVEPSPSAATFGRERLELDIVQGAFADADLDEASFNVVTMWDVLEHLHDPVAAVQKASRLLQPGGILIVRVPHLESIGARIFGRYWAGLDAPRHLHVFPRQVLTEMMRQADLHPLAWQCWGSYHIFALSLEFWLRSRRSALLHEPPWQQVLLSFPMRLLAL